MILSADQENPLNIIDTTMSESMILVLDEIERNEGLSEIRLQAARHMYNTHGFILMQSLWSEDRCKEIEKETGNFPSTLALEKGFMHVKKAALCHWN